MLSWFGKKTEAVQDPKWIVQTVSTPKTGKIARALEAFQTCESAIRAQIVQQTAYHEVTEGVVKLVAYAAHQDPDPYVRKVANGLMSARVPLRMQVLQHVTVIQ